MRFEYDTGNNPGRNEAEQQAQDALTDSLHLKGNDAIQFADAFGGKQPSNVDKEDDDRSSTDEQMPAWLMNRGRPGFDDNPAYLRTGVASDGKTLTVGPFDLTGRDITKWALNTSPAELTDLVGKYKLHDSTAAMVQSAQFAEFVGNLDRGELPSENALKEFLPSELQRVIYEKNNSK